MSYTFTGKSVSVIIALAVLSALGLTSGCKNVEEKAVASNDSYTLTLDWRPEPEFGGFYQAKSAGLYKTRGLRMQILNGGAGMSTWQLVAAGKTDFATTSADLLVEARSQGADVVGLFAVYQTSPQGIMAHQERDFNTIQDVFSNPGTLGAENNAWLKFLLAKFPNPVVKIAPDPGGIGLFMGRKDYSQQCFVTSEPIAVERAGGTSKSFLVADAGFNPYVTVLITSGKTLKEHPETVTKMVDACREGWRAYLDSPAAANKLMSELNRDMDGRTFEEVAAAQKHLIENDDTLKNGLGSMTADRWRTLIQQLMDLKVITIAPKAEDCFVNLK